MAVMVVARRLPHVALRTALPPHWRMAEVAEAVVTRPAALAMLSAVPPIAQPER